MSADAAQHVEAVEAGQSQVEQHHVGVALDGLVQTVDPVGDDDHRVPLGLQVARRGLGQRRLIFDEQNPHTYRS